MEFNCLLQIYVGRAAAVKRCKQFGITGRCELSYKYVLMTLYYSTMQL